MDTILINSFSAGLVQTIIGHPFDTIKTLNQIYPNKTDYSIFRSIIKKHGYTYLYRGSLFENTGRFLFLKFFLYAITIIK